MQNHSTATRKKPPTKSRKSESGQVPFLISQIKPSPENDQIYRPISLDDPEIIQLAASIKERGILEALVVTSDGYIVSGHRRHAAAKLAGLKTIPCRVLPIRRTDNIDEFVRLLREHNRQREKTNAERLREEIVGTSEESAVAELWAYRREKAAVGVKALKPNLVSVRCEISDAKKPMLKKALAIVELLLPYGPTNKRSIHYHMCEGEKVLRHSGKPRSWYKNDMACYHDLCDLLVRASLSGLVSMEAIVDETRPVVTWDVHQTARPFINRELDGMFRGYFRDLMQSQTNHFELLCEKNTVLPLVRPIAGEYRIPLTSGRGYCSLPPRHAMAERYRASGKEKLVLLIVSDFDPEGEDIASSFASSMRDDFKIDGVHAIKAALTYEQTKKYNLVGSLEAKSKSKRAEKFVQKYGTNVFELEALSPETLQTIVRATIESVIDREAFEAEIAAERKDARFLAGVRNTVSGVLGDIDFEEGEL